MKNTTLKLLNDAVLETLEDRRMMSTVSPAALSGGVLSVTGSQTAATRVMVDVADNNAMLTVDVSGQHSTFPAAKVTKIKITTGSGSDYIYINPHITIPSEINSGDGNDTVRGGGGDNTIISGNGNDILQAEGTNNVIQAGSGNDVIMGSKNGPNSLTAGNGNDYVGSLGLADRMTVGNGNDIISAGNGHDTITVGTGHDQFLGGLGNHYLYAKSTGAAAGSTGSSGSTSSNGSTTTATGGSGSTTSNGGTKTTTSGSTANTSTGSTSTSGSTKTTTSGSTANTSTGSTSTSGSTKTTTSGSTANTSTGSTSSSGSTTTTNSGSTSTGSSSSSSSGSSTGSTSSGSSSTNTASQAGLPTGTSDSAIVPIIASAINKIAGAQAPVAVINTLAGPRITGLVVNVDGLSSTVGTGTSITSTYAWDFGDAGAAFDQLNGFNASHVYDKPGNYTITLTVTNEDGIVSKATQQVSIAASARNQIFVDSVNGSDSNKGTQNAPLQSLAAAFAQIQNNTEILLKAGDTFYTGAGVNVANTNVLIGRYGTGVNPQIMRTIGNGLPTIAVGGSSNGVTIQDITFNSPYPMGTDGITKKIGVGGIFLGGQNIAVRDCTFRNIDDAINENGTPTGVLIQNNSTPLVNGLRGYMVWGQGAEETIIGNYSVGSVCEHVVRCVGVSELNVQDNNFTNHDGKGCIEIHVGQYDWVQGNIVNSGDIRVGPLGLWGEPATDTTSWCVIEDNQLTDTMIFVQSGTRHAMIDNNVINNSAGQAIVVNGTDAEGEYSADITIVNNTGIDTGTQGSFIELLGYANGIVMNNNVFVAPQSQLGDYSASPVRVTTGYMSDFTQITGNIWASPVSLGTYANGGVNITGQGTMGNGYVTPDQWNALSNVGTDLFENVTLGSTYEINVGSLTAGAAIKMAA